MIQCKKHNINLVRQNAYHYYCPECDRLALAEAKIIFPKLTKEYRLICSRCKCNFIAKSPRAVRCEGCKRLHALETDRKRTRLRRGKCVL